MESHPTEMAMPDETRIQTFADFYPFYLNEHANRTSRRLHFVGSSIGLVLLVTAAITGNAWLIPLSLLQGYAFAWVGHFFFEHNRPATFKYPLFSFMGDWRMWWDILPVSAGVFGVPAGIAATVLVSLITQRKADNL